MIYHLQMGGRHHRKTVHMASVTSGTAPIAVALASVNMAKRSAVGSVAGLTDALPTSATPTTAFRAKAGARARNMGKKVSTNVGCALVLASANVVASYGNAPVALAPQCFHYASTTTYTAVALSAERLAVSQRG